MKRPLKARPQQGALPTRFKKRLSGSNRPDQDTTNRISSTRLVEDLRHYQAELEIQNKALRFTQTAAEGAYERFVTLFSNVPLALMVVDDNGQILENNTRALTLLRPLESDRPLAYILPFIKPDDQDKVRMGFAIAREQGVCEINELEFDAGSNGVVTGDLHIARIDHSGENVVTYICAIIDQGPLLSQRSALQASTHTLEQRNDDLLKSQNRLASIINSSLDAIICLDPRQHILVINPSACAIFDCSQEQALSQPLIKFLPGAAQVLSHGNISNPLQLGEMMGITLQGKTVPLDVSLSIEQQPSGPIVTLFAHDLTVRKKMESQRVALELKLRESQKMQAIGTMAGGIAHDFNNIIGAILGNVELARQDIASNQAASTSLSEIDKAGRRARALVRQILTFSRNEPPHRISLQLADVVNETLRLVKVTLPPQVSLRVQIDPNTASVLADATQMEQVLLNLCTNAIQAINEQTGSILVSLSDAPEQFGKSVQLTVSDTGCGMDATTLEHIFEPFFTTKPVGQGTGLGLSVVHGIMHAHAGQVQVSSTPGHGSHFRLFFPAADPRTALLTPSTIAPTSNIGSGQRVMYVDDDEALVFLVKRLLTRKGYRVIPFTDPRAAVESLQVNPMQCDLLVTDFNMPGFSGVDLLRAVKAIRPNLTVALASGYITPEIEHDALTAGAHALIHKPNDVEEFCDTVQRLLSVGASLG